MENSDFQECKKFGVGLAKQAGEMILQAYRLQVGTSAQVQWKSDNSPVMELDNQINALVIDAITRTYPEHNIIAEEGGSISHNSEYTWLCDPVDGTLAFSLGIPTSVFSLSLVKNGECIFCVVYDPYMDNMYHAMRGLGAFNNQTKLHVSERVSIKNATVGVTIWGDAKYNCIPMITGLRQQKALPINVTSSQYMGALVASGKLQAMIYFDDKPYDIAAISLLVEEAGGVITDLFGNKQSYDVLIKGCIASSKSLHSELVKIYGC
jgi:myo-inositol-1(or 4)-monophosphatase